MVRMRKIAWGLALGVLLLAGCTRMFENPLLVDIEETIAQVIEPPEVTELFPAIGSVDVAINTSFVTVTFTKSINAATVTPSSFYIVELIDGSEGDTVPGTRDTSNQTITFNLSDLLAYDRTYRVVVTTDVQDVDGNSLPARVEWDFHTGQSPDFEAPTNPSISINSGDSWTTDSTVTLTLNASDDRSVAQYNVSNSNSFLEGNWITVEDGSWPVEIEWDIGSDQGNHTVYVRFRDGSDNQSSPASDTIQLDSMAPTVVALVLDGGKSATIDSNISVDVVGEDEDGGSGIDEFRLRLGVESVANGSLTDQDVPWLEWQALTGGSGSIVSQSIDPEVVYPGSDALALDETVTVELQVRDVAGNISTFAEEDEPGIRTIRWDQTPPSIVELQPDDGATNVVVNAGLIEVSFDEEMDRTTFSEATFNIRKAGEVEVIAGTIGSADGGTALTISEISLEQNTDYIVRVLGSVTDAAGNALGSDFSWFFSTSDAIDDTAPVGTLTLDSGLEATSTPSITLDIAAEDDWNAVRALKVWGDNDGTLPFFEEDASWQLLPDPPNLNWTLSAVDGTKYIYYKFQDAALNENDTAFRLAVSLDTVDPTITGVIINDGDAYTNSADLLVSLEINADDATSGLQEMRLSNDGVFNDTDPEVGTERWRPWSPIVPAWTLSSGDGLKTVWVEVRDGVNRESGTATDTITLDLTPPSVVFDSDDALNVNTATAQPGTLTDANGIGSYAWSQVTGPGTVTFSDDTAASPLVSANQDGVYTIRVDILDNAGNEAFGAVEFTWDTTPPAANPAVSVETYSITSQPTWTWPAVAGADFYRVSFLGSPDWENPAHYEETNQTSFTPGAPLGEGSSTLRVTAWDIAENSSGEGSDAVFVDTIPPAIDPEGQYFLTNAGRTIDYTGGGGSDGQVIETGSGIEAVLWEELSAPSNGTLTFDDDSVLNPLVGATGAGANGTYELGLTVWDQAGNETQSTFVFEWDTVAPGMPEVGGAVRTPDLTPTWGWESGGGGNGTFRWRINTGSWTETNDTSYTPSSALSDGESIETFVFEVQERDDAGNWSVAGAFSTILDTEFVAPPQITGSSLTTNNSLDWDWSSGIDADSSNDGASQADDDEYDYRVYDPSSSTWSSWTRTYEPRATYTASSDGDYVIEVREYNTSGGVPPDAGDLTGEIGSFTTDYDSTPPLPPLVSSLSPSPTNDTTPTFTWTSGGGDGIGRYWLGIDDSPIPGTQNVTYTSYTPDPLAEGTYNFQVRERDQAGNWSNPGSVSVTIDTTAPTLTSILIDDPDAVGSNYAVDTLVNLSIVASGSPAAMRFRNSGGSWSAWEPYSSSRSNWSLLTGDGWKYVYVQLRDAAGNTTSSVSDSILLDTQAPVVTSFLINNGNISTTNRTVTLNSNVSGASQMAIVNGTGTPTSWQSYSSARSWALSSGYGGRQVRIRYRDAAGNETSIYTDRIHYGNPSIQTTTKGATSNGSITVTWSNYDSQVGTDYFYVYTSTTPTGAKTSRGSSTSNSKTLSLIPGQIYYLFIRVYNSTIGWHDVYTPYMIGFSSNITIIYDANDSTDVALANEVKNTLTYDLTNYSSISGSMPSWSVTLVPETEISSSYHDPAVYDDRYIIYGDPVIVTHGTSFYSFANKVRNVIHRDTPAGSGRTGVVAMGYGGLRMLDTAENNWSSWGYSDQAPVDIGYLGETYIRSDDTITMHTWTSGNSVWSSPLNSTSLPTTNDALTQITYSSGTAGGWLTPRYTIYRPDQSNPVGGWLYGRDSSGSAYFPVVRQGRFLHFGFTNMLIRPYTGEVYFVNLMARMDNY